MMARNEERRWSVQRLEERSQVEMVTLFLFDPGPRILCHEAVVTRSEELPR